VGKLAREIERYLLSCPELAAFCSQNGWIDNETFYYEVIEQSDSALIVLVQFEEILMEGAGDVASRIACHGRLRLLLDRYGDVTGAELL